MSTFPPGGASRFPDGTDTGSPADWVRNGFDLARIPGFAGSATVGEAINTPDAPNEIVVPPPTGFCGDPVTLISAVQGSGAASPLVGQTHTVEAVVVGDFQDGTNGDLNGFHLQEEDVDSDGDSLTSEGIFVFDGSNAAVDVSIGDRVCRGADNAEELTTQRDMIAAAITAIDADVVRLIGIENNVDDDAVIDLVDSLNAVSGAGTYDYVATGAIGTDAIKVAIVYRPETVSPVGRHAILDSSVDPRFIDTKSRPVLAQSFADSSGSVFTVAVNHLKSKGSDCNDVGDPDLGDGAGNCNVTRTSAAAALVHWLATDPTGSGDADALIIGDLNSYDKEDPIDAIVAGADDTTGSTDDYSDLIQLFQGEDAYSYVFDGQIGYLDHALASAGLVDQITGVTCLAHQRRRGRPDRLRHVVQAAGTGCDLRAGPVSILRSRPGRDRAAAGHTAVPEGVHAFRALRGHSHR